MEIALVAFMKRSLSLDMPKTVTLSKQVPELNIL